MHLKLVPLRLLCASMRIDFVWLVGRPTSNVCFSKSRERTVSESSKDATCGLLHYAASDAFAYAWHAEVETIKTIKTIRTILLAKKDHAISWSYRTALLTIDRAHSKKIAALYVAVAFALPAIGPDAWLAHGARQESNSNPLLRFPHWSRNAFKQSKTRANCATCHRKIAVRAFVRAEAVIGDLIDGQSQSPRRDREPERPI